MSTLPEFRLEVHLARWEFAARFHMTASDVQTTTIGELLALAGDGARERFESLALGYTESAGSPALRGAIARTYAARSADDVLCFAGAEEGLFCAMRSLLDTGDHAIVVTPNYVTAA